MSTPWKLAHAESTESHHASIRRFGGWLCGVCGEDLRPQRVEETGTSKQARLTSLARTLGEEGRPDEAELVRGAVAYIDAAHEALK